VTMVRTKVPTGKGWMNSNNIYKACKAKGKYGGIRT